MTVTTRSMRHFAADCLKWATENKDASQRQLIVDTARMWARTADQIDKLLANGAEPVDDLKSKLN